jgi:hypothetical protein
MSIQPRLTDFFDKGLPVSGSEVYHACSKRLKVLSWVVGRTPLAEQRRLLGLTKQALNKHLVSLVKLGWVERKSIKRGEGVYEATPEGLKQLEFGKPSLIYGAFSVNQKAANWLSVHFFKVRFNLKGSHFDKAGLEKGAKGRWTAYDDNPPTTLEVRKRCLSVTVHGLRGSNAAEIARKGLLAARERVLAFCARRGARVFEQGEFSGMPHWVIEELNTSKELSNILHLRQGGPAVRLAGLDWYIDGSHEGLVEARGELESAKRVFGEFEYLLRGGLHRDLELVKSELASVKDVAREVAALREELRFKPSGLPRRDVV